MPSSWLASRWLASLNETSVHCGKPTAAGWCRQCVRLLFSGAQCSAPGVHAQVERQSERRLHHARVAHRDHRLIRVPCDQAGQCAARAGQERHPALTARREHPVRIRHRRQLLASAVPGPPLLHTQPVGLTRTQLVQPVVRQHRQVQRRRDVLGGFQCPRQSAGHEPVRPDSPLQQPLLQQPGLLPSPRRQPPVAMHPADHRLDVRHRFAVPHQVQLRRHQDLPRAAVALPVPSVAHSRGRARGGPRSRGRDRRRRRPAGASDTCQWCPPGVCAKSQPGRRDRAATSPAVCRRLELHRIVSTLRLGQQQARSTTTLLLLGWRSGNEQALLD